MQKLGILHIKKTLEYILKKGLFKATKLIANQISSSNKLKIKVLNIDFNSKINNKIEIQIFRCIQELLTNIIKHANASEVVIQFSEDNRNLNILIEDNGIGFNLTTVKKGIGLININKRINNILGNITIDSALGNGTTVILNIPI